VATVPAPTADVAMTDVIQADLAARALLPAEQLLEAGSGSAEQLVTSATKHQIELVGPVLLDTSWQAVAAEGFDVTCFAIDWEARTVTCPAGTVRRSWSEARRDDYPFYQVKFSRTECRACPVRDRCTRCAKGPRQLALRPREEHEAVQAARQRQTTEECAGRERQRAGSEGTLAQGLQDCDLRQARLCRSETASNASGCRNRAAAHRVGRTVPARAPHLVTGYDRLLRARPRFTPHRR
jgi:DDE family transposase